MWKIGDTVDAAPIIEKALYTIQTTNHRFNIDANCYMSSYASVPSNSDLYINHDVTITSSGDGGFTLMNRDTSVYKYSGASNIIVHGGGVFDFNSRNTNSPTNSAFTIYHCSNVIIDGITFKDPASYHVIEIGGSEHITVKNCKFFGFRPIATSALPAASIKGECIQIEHTSDGNGGIPVPYFDKTECKDIIIKDNLFDGLYTFDSDGNKVYSTYMWRPIGCHEDQVGATEFVYHDGLLVEGNTFNSVRQVCVTPRYINNCSIINNTATDLQGIFVSGLPVGKSYYNVPFDFNNVKISGNIVRFDNTVTSNTLVSSIYTVGRNNWGAIDLIGTTGSIITDNEIYDAPNSSIILDCCPNTLILNNKFHGWNTIDKNKGAASNNRAAIDIMDSTPEPDNKQVKEVTKNVSMSGNLFVDDWTSFPIRPFTRNKADIENSWNIIDNVFNIANPAWRFVPPTTVNALDLSSFGSALVGNHPVWNKGFKGKSFTRDTDGRNIYFDGTTWLNEDGTLIAKVAMVSSIDQISSPSTIYKITHDINLGGATINIPSNCTLDFQGGNFSNGTLMGNNTKIKAGLEKIFDANTTLLGSWDIEAIYTEWFGAKGDNLSDDSFPIQQALNLGNLTKTSVKLLPKTYKITQTLDVYNQSIIQGSTNSIGYWSTKGSILIQYSPIPVINLKATTERAVISGLSIEGISITYNNSVTLNEECIGINISDDISRVKGILFKNLFVYNCWYGFRFKAYDTIDRGYSLNAWEGCYFLRNICGVYFYGNGVGGNWMNLNSFKDCGFSENKQIGISIIGFNSLQENEFYSCSFEKNGYTNEDDFIGVGIEIQIQINGGITTLSNCYLEYNVSKKITDTYTIYDKTNRDFDKSANVVVTGGTVCIRNSMIAGSPNYVYLAYKGSSVILENNQYINSIGDLSCNKILTVSNIVIAEGFLTGIKINEPLVNSIKGVFNFINNADIRDSNIDVNVCLSDHSKILLSYNSLKYFNYDYLFLDGSSTGDNLLGIEADNGFRSVGQLLRTTQSFSTNYIRVKFNSDITEKAYTSILHSKKILIEGNSKTWFINNNSINSSNMFEWNNCDVIINNLTIDFTNTKNALNFIKSSFGGKITFNNCNFIINTNQVNGFLSGFNILFNNCTFSGNIVPPGNFYIRVRTNDSLKLVNTEYPFTLKYSYKGNTSNRPALSTKDFGYTYYDIQLNKYIVWTGTTWVNIDGTPLT